MQKPEFRATLPYFISALSQFQPNNPHTSPLIPYDLPGPPLSSRCSTLHSETVAAAFILLSPARHHILSHRMQTHTTHSMQLGSSSRAHYGRHHRVSRHETPSGAALRDRPSQQKQHHQQHHKQQRHVSLAAAAASVDASSLVIGYTTPEQYFPVSGGCLATLQHVFAGVFVWVWCTLT